MFNKKRTCLLPVRVVSVISKYELNINLHVLLAQPQKILTLRAITFQNGCNITGIVILLAGDLHHIAFFFVMKIPNPKKINSDFTLTASQSTKWKLGASLVGLKISKWNDLDSLAKHAMSLKRKNGHVTAEWSLDMYISSLSKIAAKYISHTALREFAGDLHVYLKQKEVKARYNKVFAKLQLQKDNDEAEEELELVVETNAKKNATLTGLKRKQQLNKEINDIQASAHNTNQDSEDDTDENEPGEQVPKAKKSNTNQTISLSDVKRAIYTKARKIHAMYKSGKTITPDERKLMSCGGSLILDLIDQTDNNEFRKLFTKEAWDALNKKFKEDLLLNEATIPTTLLDKFKYAARLAMTRNGCGDSLVYFSSIYSQEAMTTIQRGYIKLFTTMFDIVQNSSYILRSSHKKNNSEGNYLTEIWFPVLKSLFAINGNLIRLKAGETIPENSTEEKTKLYIGEKNIVGFKTDIRFIYDYEDSEFDIGALEVCLPDADDAKVTDDEAKLLREGKSIVTVLHKVSSGDIDTSWIIQVSGLKAYFSTITYIGHDLYVGIQQNEISFPSCIGELNDDAKSLKFFQGLFQLRDNIERCAHSIQRKINQTNNDQNTTYAKFHDTGFVSPPYRHVHSESQTWYTPPNGTNTRSVFTDLNSGLLGSGNDVTTDIASSDHASDNELDDESENDGIDSHGFIKSGDRWYDPLTETYFDHHPYL